MTFPQVRESSKRQDRIVGCSKMDQAMHDSTEKRETELHNLDQLTSNWLAVHNAGYRVMLTPCGIRGRQAIERVGPPA